MARGRGGWTRDKMLLIINKLDETSLDKPKLLRQIPFTLFGGSVMWGQRAGWMDQRAHTLQTRITERRSETPRCLKTQRRESPTMLGGFRGVPGSGSRPASSLLIWRGRI